MQYPEILTIQLLMRNIANHTMVVLQKKDIDPLPLCIFTGAVKGAGITQLTWEIQPNWYKKRSLLAY